MLDIKLIRENPDVVKNDLKKRGDIDKINMLQKLIVMDKKRRELIQKADVLRMERNSATERISAMRREGKDVSYELVKIKDIPDKIKKLEEELDVLNNECRNILMILPNILHKSVPVGKDEAQNVEVRKWGEKEWYFEPKNHIDIATHLGLLDIERAARASGERFYYIKDKLAVLDISLQRFAIDFLIKKGFVLVEPPLMLRRKAYEGAIDLNDFENMIYKIEDADEYLIATSEHPIAAMFMNEVLLKKDLPIKIVGVSPCFRKELGAHGKYTKGLFRMHHFNKVEQFVFCHPKDSWQIHDELLHNSETILQELGIPYRTVVLCSGDTGKVSAKTYDLEFLMADGKYREIASISNCTDYQARRLGIKYRESEGKASEGFVHTLNGTALVTSRVMVAILENFQNPDGTVDIPKALQKYTGFKKID